MLPKAPGLNPDKHTSHLTQGDVQGWETEEESYLLRSSVLCCGPARVQSVSKGRFAPLNTLAFK